MSSWKSGNKSISSTWRRTTKSSSWNSSDKRKAVFIKEDRKLKLISEVDSQIPSKLKKQLSLIDEIVETDEKTLIQVYQKIEESEESINSVYSVIEYAFKIRPLNTKPLITLLCLLSQRHGYRKSRINSDKLYSMLLQEGIVCKQKNRKEITIQEGEIIKIIKQDNLDSFIKKSSESGFNSTIYSRNKGTEELLFLPTEGPSRKE